MKYLQEYIDKQLTQTFKKHGAFFAFSTEQFEKEKKENTKYINLGAGLICPKDNADQLIKEINNITKKGIVKDLKENGKLNVIKRELNNYEAYYTGDIETTVEALKGYPITQEEIKKVFKSGHL